MKTAVASAEPEETAGREIKPEFYPAARRDTAVSDNYHGTVIGDPYRWLEDDRSEETTKWVKAENEVTEDYLRRIPYREKIMRALTGLMNYAKEEMPERAGEYYFFLRNDGLQDQSVLYYQKGLDGIPEIFIDPNALSESGTVALTGVTFSKDNRYAAYTLASAGSDWSEIHVVEIATRKKLPDVVRWVKFSEASWGKDGFYYSRYDEPPAGEKFSARNECQKVYYHRLGTSQHADRTIYEDKTHPRRYFASRVSDDLRYLFIVVSEGTHGTEILYRRLGSPGGFDVLCKGFEYDYEIIACENDRVWLRTNRSAPHYKVVRIVLGKPMLEEEDIIPEQEQVMEWASMAGGNLFAGYLRNASGRVYQYEPGGRFIREVKLPALGTVSGFSGKPEDREVFYRFTGFTIPPAFYRYVISGGVSKLYRRTEVPFDTERFTAEQVFYRSNDDTPVPMFLVYKKGLVKDGKRPVYLYAYGGFNISITPFFSPSKVVLLEQGGIWAIPNIRGGGEYGEAWHRAGMLDNKQQVFDDFIAAAEYLIAEKYTSRDKLAIAGGSNGGLLVGACMTQRPDLFAVAFPMVGVLDMLRYHTFTIGWGWVVEYGSSDDPSLFPYLLAYSPLHNVRKGTCYPATLIMTADHDDRVVPAHSFKFGAALQAAQGCDRPVLVRIETEAGHGAGKPLSKIIRSEADMWSFFFWHTHTDYRE